MPTTSTKYIRTIDLLEMMKGPVTEWQSVRSGSQMMYRPYLFVDQPLPRGIMEWRTKKSLKIHYDISNTEMSDTLQNNTGKENFEFIITHTFIVTFLP